MTPIGIGRIVVLSMLVSPLAFAQATGDETDTPEVWLCHHDIEALASEGADWDFVRAHLDGIKVYVGNIAGSPKHRQISDERLTALLEILAENEIQLSMECGGTMGHYRSDLSAGRLSAERELARIDRIAALGGTLDYLDMDGPVSRTLLPGRHRFDHRKRGNTGYAEIDRAVDELVLYMQCINRRYPDQEFFTLTNFPNWGWKGGTSYHARHENRQDWGDYFEVLSTLVRRAREQELSSLVGVTVDSPYHYTTGRVPSVNLDDPAAVDWVGRICDLEDYVHGQGLEFNLIVNSVERTEVDAETYCKQTLALIDLFEEAGGRADRYIVQSWGHHPAHMLPESDPTSMTGLTKSVIEKVQGIREDSVAGSP